jgi:hypothetical protein
MMTRRPGSAPPFHAKDNCYPLSGTGVPAGVLTRISHTRVVGTEKIFRQIRRNTGGDAGATELFRGNGFEATPYFSSLCWRL